MHHQVRESQRRSTGETPQVQSMEVEKITKVILEVAAGVAGIAKETPDGSEMRRRQEEVESEVRELKRMHESEVR